MKRSSSIHNPPQSTARWLQGEVRRAIVDMDFAPGIRLSELDLAERYSVSRQPVREAMISLANDNLVDIRPQRGTFVSHLSIERMRESRLLREAMETTIIRHACRHFDSTLLPEIVTNLGIQRVQAEAGDRAAFQRADAEFHALLAQGAGFPHAWETIQNLKQHTDRICKLTLASPTVMLELVDEHRLIFAAVQAKKTAVAVHLLHRHLTAVLRTLPDIKRRFPHWFELTEPLT